MTWLFVGLAFLVFMGLVWSVHALDDVALARYGYAPFGMPNVLFMLVPHGLVLYAVQQGGEGMEIPVTLAAAGLLAMLLIVKMRTNGWIALYAAPAMLLAAPVIFFSVLFRSLARSGSGAE